MLIIPYSSVSLYLTNKQQSEDDNKLIDTMPQDVLHHGEGDEGVVTAVGFSQ